MGDNTKPARPEVVDATVICATFPLLHGKQITRDNFIYTFEQILGGEVQVLLIEGKEEIGKTTVLAQFARSHADRALSIFIRLANRFSYDPTILVKDLCNQAYWILRREDLPSEQVADETSFRSLLLELQRRARRMGSDFYFVVDGLERLQDDRAEIRELILSLLPIGAKGFKFLITGKETGFGGHLRGVPYKPTTLTGFTLEETLSYFGQSCADPEIVNVLYRTFNGVPGRLATVKRLLETGLNPNELLDTLPNTVPNLFELEWESVDRNNEQLLQILALIANDKDGYNLDTLAQIFDSDIVALQKMLQPLIFLQISSSKTGSIEFVSEPFRRFVASKLKEIQAFVRERVIGWLLKRPESAEALSLLPGYLREAGQRRKLLEYLSPAHFAAMLQRSQSLAPVKQKAELGVVTSLAEERDADLLRFSIHEAAISEVDGCDVSRTEIEARVALGEYRTAVDLALGVTLKKDRIRLLAAVARFQRESGISPELELLEMIEQLYKQVEAEEFGKDAFEFASDLMYSKPGLAIQLVENASPSAAEDRSFDWALARLSIEGMISEQRASAGLNDKIEGIRHRIKDPAPMRFSTEISVLLSNYSAKQAILEAEKLGSGIEQIFFLRRWTASTTKYEGASEAVEFALRLAIRSTTLKLTASDLRELATPLPKISDAVELRRLVGMFDAQKGLAERSGPTEDFVRLGLLLCQSEARYDLEAAGSRLMEIFYFVNDVPELATKAACLARLYSATAAIDPQSKLTESQEVRRTTLSDLRATIQKLLGSTADHLVVTKRILKALARTEIEIALEISTALNTEPRRDQAIFEIITECLDQNVRDIPFEIISLALSRFADADFGDKVLEALLERIELVSDKDVITDLLSRLLPFIDAIGSIRDNGRKCRAACSAIGLLEKGGAERYSGLLGKTIALLNQAWVEMDDSWKKVDQGFEISVRLAAHLRDTAIEYAKKSQILRDDLSLDYEIGSYLSCVRLAIRAFSGLLPKDLAVEEDYERLSHQINRVPSIATQIGLWTDVALQCFRFERSEQGTKVTVEKIRPLLAVLKEGKSFEWVYAMVSALPALYLAHHKTAVEHLNYLPRDYRDLALRNTFGFIKQKTSRGDPFDAPEDKYNISYDEGVDICELLEEVDDDSLFYSQLNDLVESALWKANKNAWTEDQRLEIARRLEDLIQRKLPNKRFITHDGFKIISNAQVARLRRQTRGSSWQALLKTVDAVSNPSDKSYILANLALVSSSVDLLKEAKTLADEIPSLLDRTDRYLAIADRAVKLDSKFARELLRNACGLLNSADPADTHSYRRRIVDDAYQIDSELASSLASEFDDDEARVAARQRLAVQKLRKDLSNSVELSVDHLKFNQDLSRVAWMLLSSLNSDRLASRPVKDTRNLLQVASGKPLQEAYPILCYVIENAIHQRAYANEAKTFVRELFDATTLSCELIYAIAVRPTKKSSLRRTTETSIATGKQIIRTGHRHEAIEYLRQWLRESASDYLKICDPYFGPKDLEILKLVLEAAPTLPVYILTNKNHQDHEGIAQPWRATYQAIWSQEFSDQSPPSTSIFVIGTSAGGSPIHDRWWLTRGKGLRFGTSFNSLGMSKDSEISILQAREVAEREAETDQYLYLQRREYLGEKLFIESYTL